MKTPNWRELDLAGKCGSCRHYGQWIVKGQETARGGCGIKNNLYKQRTETCKKYEGAGQ